MRPESASNLLGRGTPAPGGFSPFCGSWPRHFPCPSARAMPCASSAVRLPRGAAGTSGSFSVGAGVSDRDRAPGELRGRPGTTDPPGPAQNSPKSCWSQWIRRPRVSPEPGRTTRPFPGRRGASTPPWPGTPGDHVGPLTEETPKPCRALQTDPAAPSRQGTRFQDQ